MNILAVYCATLLSSHHQQASLIDSGFYTITANMEDKSEEENMLLGGNFVVVEKRDTSTKRGTLFIEARIRDDLMEDPHQEVVESKVRTFHFMLAVS